MFASTASTVKCPHCAAEFRLVPIFAPAGDQVSAGHQTLLRPTQMKLPQGTDGKDNGKGKVPGKVSGKGKGLRSLPLRSPPPLASSSSSAAPRTPLRMPPSAKSDLHPKPPSAPPPRRTLAGTGRHTRLAPAPKRSDSAGSSPDEVIDEDHTEIDIGRASASEEEAADIDQEADDEEDDHTAEEHSPRPPWKKGRMDRG
jgi:hypothetical protein